MSLFLLKFLVLNLDNNPDGAFEFGQKDLSSKMILEWQTAAKALLSA